MEGKGTSLKRTPTARDRFHGPLLPREDLDLRANRDDPLLVHGYVQPFVDQVLHIGNSVGCLYRKDDGMSSERPDKDPHGNELFELVLTGSVAPRNNNAD